MTHHSEDPGAAPGPPGTESPSPATGEQTPFDRFRDFARKVVSVPKAELDERERAFRESRSGKPRRRPA